MRKIIFPNDFVSYYPIGIQVSPMYLDVANRIFDKIKDFALAHPMASEVKKEIAITAAIYYEDKMSDIGLWNAFVSLHRSMYSRSLPFFDDSESLDEDDVNADEVELLIWLVLSRNVEDCFINPLALGKDIVDVIMEVFMEYDEVEVNETLYSYIYDKNIANDYFNLKRVLFWLSGSYLLYSYYDNRFERLLLSYSRSFNKKDSIYFAESIYTMTTEIGPLALMPHEWLAEMYRGKKMYQEADKLKNIEYCDSGAFCVMDVDKKTAIFKDTKGIERKIVNPEAKVLKKGSFVYSALVKYGNNDWKINGALLSSDKEYYDEKCKKEKKLATAYEVAYPSYMEYTNGKRMAFFEKKSQLVEWLKKVFLDTEVEKISDKLPDCPMVTFISKKAGIIFAPEIVHAIKHKDNPYYKKCDRAELQTETISALIDIDVVHPEMLNYLLKNNMLVDGNLSGMNPSEQGNIIFTQNIDFIARNYRRYNYHDHDF